MLMARDAFAIAQSGVVTLSLPVGARPTAMGEAFTGLANDANAIFYNPAGLGQSPLTLSWKTHRSGSAFNAVAARSAATFGAREYVWAGSHSGITRFNGKIWENNEIYLPEDGESVRSIALRYFADDDREIVNEAIWEIRRENKLGMRRYEHLVALLRTQAALFKDETAPFNPESYAKMLILLTPNEVVVSHISEKVLPQYMDESTRKDLAERIVTTLETEDRGVSQMTELSIPFTIAIRDTVTTMTLDASERLWVGTVNGLWMYHNSKWRRYTADGNDETGLPSNRITGIAVSPDGRNVAIATENGLALMKDANRENITIFRREEGAFAIGGGVKAAAEAVKKETAEVAKAVPAVDAADVEAAQKGAANTETAEDVEDAELADNETAENAADTETVDAKADGRDAADGETVDTETVEKDSKDKNDYAEASENGADAETVTKKAEVIEDIVTETADDADGTAEAAGKGGLPDNYITSVAFVGNDRLYAGTPASGLAMIDVGAGSVSAVFDTSSGLLAQGVTTLFTDSKGRLWIGGENGVTIYSSGTRNWLRYRFPGSLVYSFAEQSNNTIWIGTNRGVITHRDGKPKMGKDGVMATTPEWKTYHSKNALKDDNIRAVAACGKDMWIATDAAMQQHAHAETQVLLFYEQLLPAFKMSDLWHAFPAIVIPTEDWGTIGLSVNFTNLGDNERWSELEDYLGRSRSWEGAFGISYGFPVKEDLSVGLNAKYVCSALDPSVGGVGHTFAIDAGILKRNLFINRFDVGFMLQNMGPAIYYLTPEEADPIPFTLRLGLAYKPVQTPFHELTLVADAYREVVRTYYDKKPDPFWVALWTGMLADDTRPGKEQIQEINVSLGAEYMYADFMALRLGFLGDYLGERFELSMGLGVKYANMNFDFSYIYSPPGFMGGMLRAINEEKEGASGARDGQWRISFLFGL